MVSGRPGLRLPDLGRCGGVSHGSFRREGAGRSALRGARMGSASFVQNLCQGPKMWSSRGRPEHGRAAGLLWKTLCMKWDVQFSPFDLRTALLAGKGIVEGWVFGPARGRSGRVGRWAHLWMEVWGHLVCRWAGTA